MVPLLASVKAEIVRGGSGKPDYRTLLRNYGGLEALFIDSYFTGAVRNEKTSCKGVCSFRERCCFVVFPECGFLRDLVDFS